MGKVPNIEMADNLNQPKNDDAVLGGQIPAPADGGVLGGIAGVKRHLASTIIGQRVAALYQALNYGEAGLELVIQALEDKSKQVQQVAQNLLFEKRANPKVRQVLLLRYPNVLFECLYTLSSADGFEISTVAISPDGQTFASCSFRYTIELWNMYTGELIHTFAQSTGRGGCRFCSVAFSPDGQKLASTVEDGTIKVWDLHTGELLHHFGEGSESFDTITCVAFSPDGQSLVSGNWHGSIKVWNLQTPEVKSNLPSTGGTIMSLAVNPLQPFFATTCGTIELWDINTLEPLGDKCSNRGFHSVAFSADGQIFAAGGGDHTISLWNLDTGERLHKLEGNPEEVHSLAFSPDGQFLASSGLDNDIHLWDLATGERFHTLKGHSDHVNEVAISPDGQTLISGSCDRTIKVWGIC